MRQKQTFRLYAAYSNLRKSVTEFLNGTAIDCKYSTATHYVLRVGADAFTISHKHVHCRITWTVINGTVSRIEVAMSRIRSEKQYKAPEEGKRDQLLRHDRNCN